MRKIIKNILTILLVLLIFLLVATSASLILLSTSRVQTWLVQKVSYNLSEKFGSDIYIEKIKFTFFNHLNINNILIKDQNNDTLIFTHELGVNIRSINLVSGKINLGNLKVEKPVFNLVTDSTGMLNLKWYLNKLRKNGEDNKTRHKEQFINISSIIINDGSFRLKNRINNPSKSLIDFSNLKLDSLNGTISNLLIINDSLSLKINRMAFREKSGFRVKNFSSGLSIQNNNIIFDKIFAQTDSSVMVVPLLVMQADSSGSFREFTENVRLDIRLENCQLAIPELRYFMPANVLPSNKVSLTGDISGFISELRGKKIRIKLPEKTIFEMNFSLSGLPDINNTFIFCEVQRLQTSASDIEKINIPGAFPLYLPPNLQEVDTILFTGTFTGFITDFVTYGKLYTSLGTLSSDISLRPESSKRFLIKGLLRGDELDLGTLFGNNSLFGKAKFSADINGETESFKTFAVDLKGKIDSIEINNYNYRNIDLNGYFTEKTWDGSVKVEDDNIKMELLGMFDFRKGLPEFDFTLNLRNANLYKLNFDRKDTTSAASFLLTANFSGRNIDNLHGEIKLLNSSFKKYGNKLDLYDFTIRTSSKENINSLVVNTDFVDAEIMGNYNFSSLRNEFGRVLSAMFPSRFKSISHDKVNSGNDFTLKINFKNTEPLSKFLKSGLYFADNSLITGSVISDSLILLSGQFKRLDVKNNSFSNLAFDMKYCDSTFNSIITTSSLDVMNLIELKNLKVNFSSSPDNFKTSLIWDDKSNVPNKGLLEIAGVFGKNELTVGSDKNTILKLSVLPGEVLSKNNRWEINPAEITIDSTSLKINNFMVSNNNNYFSIYGAASHDKQDTIYIKLNGINISGLNNLYEKRNAGSSNNLHLALGGILGGTLSFTDIYKNIMFQSDLTISNFALLNSKYGNLRIGSVWNRESKLAEIEINNLYEGKRMLDVKGYYDPENKYLNLGAKADKLPIDILNALLSTFASGISGTTSGKVIFSGPLNNLSLTGSLFADNASIKIDFLQTRYRFSDSIRFNPGAIRFNNIVFIDERGNTGSLNGVVSHRNFKDYSVDLTIKTNDCMVLNTREKDNEIFYGTAFATGIATIKTIRNILRLDISAKTGRNTRFFIPLNTGMSVTENAFITFVTPDKSDKEEPSGKILFQSQEEPKTSMELAFDLEVTPNAEVQLLMDPKAGDIMKGTGTGNINISLDQKGIFKIFGDYTISNGDYLFTLGNIINKPFSVLNGGKITFNGDLERADIDIKAVYHTKASLYDIMPGLLPDEKLKERIPVECQLLLTGRLFNPVVGFDINLPTADEETRAYLRSMIKSEEEMSRQFLFLLVMNSFYANPTAGMQMRTADLGLSTAGFTTLEMLSNQVSNWLSQISNDFDIGIVYRPGSTTLPNSQELQVALSTQLLNDRVTINGNFDVAGTQTGRVGTSNINAVTGAFDIEYKISEHLRFKFFNRSNDNLYIDKGVQYTQGISLFYRQDFNKLKDLFGKKEKSPIKKEEEIEIVNK